jgi:5'-deoxynucleotidase YfbR-like HD superfamily hydrolase
VEIDGRYQISPPLYVSPIGVPSSYTSIELTDETNELIEKLINDFFPKVKPLGIDKMTEKFISRDTPMVDRLIDKDCLDWFVDEIERDGFQLKLKN